MTPFVFSLSSSAEARGQALVLYRPLTIPEGGDGNQEERKLRTLADVEASGMDMNVPVDVEPHIGIQKRNNSSKSRRKKTKEKKANKANSQLELTTKFLLDVNTSAKPTPKLRKKYNSTV
ncbi:hypothetical protein PQX77_003438 [Marasmius sp. AFHP31]|nr:hypothetical protein PQX77_003438 [Marasmius sp. AFHP31]